jgi:hypothetical protein
MNNAENEEKASACWYLTCRGGKKYPKAINTRIYKRSDKGKGKKKEDNDWGSRVMKRIS